MKKLLTIAALSTTILTNIAFAEPGDDLMLKFLGTGSKIVLDSSINIPAGLSHVYVQWGKVIQSELIDSRDPYCAFQLDEGVRRTDSIISKEKILTVKRVVGHPYFQDALELETEKGTILNFACTNYYGAHSSTTIRVTKQVLAGLAHLELAEPDEI